MRKIGAVVAAMAVLLLAASTAGAQQDVSPGRYTPTVHGGQSPVQSEIPPNPYSPIDQGQVPASPPTNLSSARNDIPAVTE